MGGDLDPVRALRDALLRLERECWLDGSANRKPDPSGRRSPMAEDARRAVWEAVERLMSCAEKTERGA